MTKIIWYPNGPQDDETAETSNVENLATWVCDHKHLFKRDIYIWQNQISVETRVTDATPELLSETDAVFHVSEKPNGPEVWIPLIISVVVGVASVVFAPTVDVPDVTNSNKSSTNALQQRSNAPRLNKRLPDIRGREPKAFADLWMSYTKFDRNKEFEISYLCLSVGECAVSESTVLDGDTVLSSIDGASAQFYKPYESPNSGNAPFLQIGDVIDDTLSQVRQSNEVDGATLLPPNDSSIAGDFRVFDTGRIEVVNDDTVDFRSIYIVGDEIDLKNFYSFEVIVDPEYYRLTASGTYTITAVEEFSITVDTSSNPTPWAYFTGDIIRSFAWINIITRTEWQIANPADPDWERIDWESGVQPTASKTVGPFDCSNTTDVWLNLVAQGGIYKKKTSPTYFDVELRVRFNDKDSGAQTTHNVFMSSNREDPVQSTFEFAVPYENCELSVLRLTPTDYEFDGNVVDEIKWRDLYLTDPVTATQFGNVTTIFTKTRATDSALRVKERKLSCEAVRYMTRFDGTHIASDDMADVIYSMHTDPFIGRRRATSIDHVGLYALQQQIINYYGRADSVKVGFTFDDDTYRYEDHLLLICGAVNVSPYQVGSLIKFHFEGPQEFSTQQFGHRSKLPTESGGTERRTRLLHPNEDFDGVELTYKDIATGDFETIYLPSDQSATNPFVKDYNGCFIAQNALVHANRLRQKQKFERITHEFTALDKARLLAQGQRVDVIDNTRSQTNDGYIDGVDGLRYYLSQPSDLTGSAAIVLTKRDGSVEGIPVTVDTDGRSVVLDYPPAEAPYVGYLADRSEYSLAVDNVRTSLAMLVKTIEPSEVDNVLVTCINYDVRYYSEDLL